MPKIYLSNWSSHGTKGCHGPGKLLSIMVRTSRFAKPDGIIPGLMPRAIDFAEYKDGKIDLDTYRDRYFENSWEVDFSPGRLTWQPYSFLAQVVETPVGDGDTLCCICSREKAAKGECHRAWIAEFLLRAGWEVVLDGKKFVP